MNFSIIFLLQIPEQLSEQCIVYVDIHFFYIGLVIHVFDINHSCFLLNIACLSNDSIAVNNLARPTIPAILNTHQTKIE